MVVIHVLLLIFGLWIGTRIGLLGLAMFCYAVGLMYVLIKVPIHYYKMLATPLYDVMSAGTADMIALLGIFLLVAVAAIELGWQMVGSDTLLDLPAGVDHALGGAVGGALGWVMIELMLGS